MKNKIKHLLLCKTTTLFLRILTNFWICQKNGVHTCNKNELLLTNQSMHIFFFAKSVSEMFFFLNDIEKFGLLNPSFFSITYLLLYKEFYMLQLQKFHL